MQSGINVFTSFGTNDIWFMAQAAWRTLMISAVSIALGTLLGVICGWLLHEGRILAAVLLAPLLDAFRSVPLIIQLVLFYNFAPIIGLNLDPFASGVIVLTLYTAALVANVAQGGMQAVGVPMRRAARSLGMSYCRICAMWSFRSARARSFPPGWGWRSA